MNKIALSAASAVVAGAITATVWTFAAPDLRADLQSAHAEYARLKQVTSPEGSAADRAAIANEFTTTATAIARGLQERQKRAPNAAPASDAGASGEVTARGHRDHGNATAQAAALTFAWACDTCDPDELAKLVAFDAAGREEAARVLASMPEEVRRAYPNVEAFYGMLLAASCLEAPPPGADMMQRFMNVVEIGPGRAATRRVGSDRNTHEYVLTESGWKYELPVAGVKGLPGILNSDTLTRLSRQ